MKKYNTILWDLDGTLLDFKLSERYALGVCLEMHGLTMTEELLALYSGINDSYWKKLERGEVAKKDLLVWRFRDFFQAAGIDHVDPAAIQDRYQRELGTKTFYRDDSKTLLLKLKELGYKQYMVTNGVKITQDIKMRNSGFDQIIDDIFISEEIGFEKPRKEYFDRCFEKIPGFALEKAILIGDSLTSDMQGAINAGVDACWYDPEKHADCPQDILYQISDLWELMPILGEA